MPTFFSLPRELRDQIYHHVWLATPTIKPYNHLVSLTTWSRYNSSGSLRETLPDGPHITSSASPGLPTWLLTNRAIFSEGCEQFHRLGHTFVDFKGDAAYKYTSLPFVLGAHDIHFVPRMDRWNPHVNAQVLRHPRADDVAYIKSIVSQAENVRTVRITLDMDLGQTGQYVDLWRLHVLGPLCESEDLKRIVLDVVCEELPDQSTSTVEPSLRAEVDRLASVCGGMEVEVSKEMWNDGFLNVFEWRFVLEKV